MASDELIATLYKVYDNLENIKHMDNSSIIVQYGNTTIPMNKETFLKLVNSEESIRLANKLNSLGQNEYILVAYFDGCILGNVTKIN